MKTYFCRLVPPRATFGEDMSPDEAALMQAHVGHWLQSPLWKGMLAFGPVADPAGFFGVAILEADDDLDVVRRTTEDDPVIRAGRGFRYEIHIMPLGAMHR
jgi:uncharacterized protein